MNVSMISILWKEIASLNISKNQNQYKTNYSKLGQQFIAGFTQIIRPVFITLVLCPHMILYEPLMDLQPQPSPSPTASSPPLKM